jgi:hypothetical protein
VAQQNPWPFAHRIAVGHAGPKDHAVEEAGIGKEVAEFSGAGPVHRVDRIAVIGITEWYSNKDEPT